VPRLQAVPWPDQVISFQRDGWELARYHAGTNQPRPFLFPIVGPTGRSLTRMGHPHDPEGHSHHNSFWISHHDVNGVSFWDDRAPGRILQRRLERLDDGDTAASVLVENAWVATNLLLLTERRLVSARSLPDDEWLLVLDLHLEARASTVTLGKTPFGLTGVRVARSLGVNDGGGTIRNSEGGINEAGVFWKSARWVDYSGAIAPDKIEGLTLFDHPGNTNHPSVFHVRDDGWMGASLTFAGPIELKPGAPLRLRYGLYVHRGMPAPQVIDEAWRGFAALPPPDWKTRK
jgi:hypothetical protein